MDDSIDLGDNYRFIQDHPSAIIYNTDTTSKSSGVNIVPPEVITYAYNDRYIIAKSQEVDEMTGEKKDKLKKFWVIDKSLKGDTVEPMDSIEFYKTLKEDNITLSFNKD